MSDFDRMKAMLKRAARDGMASQGRVGLEPGPACVARILEQAAVLGQRLGFDFGDGTRLVCEASGRRLVRLLAPAPSGLSAEQRALFDRAELATDDLQVLSKLLVELCARGSGFEMTAEPLGDAIEPVHGGVNPADIAKAAGLPAEALFGAQDGPTPEAFLDALGRSVLSVIQIDGEEAALIHGEGEDAAFLFDWVEHGLGTLLSPDFPLFGTLETNGILVFALPEAAGRHLLVAGERGRFTVAAVKGSDVAATLDHWREGWGGRSRSVSG